MKKRLTLSIFISLFAIAVAGLALRVSTNIQNTGNAFVTGQVFVGGAGVATCSLEGGNCISALGGCATYSLTSINGYCAGGASCCGGPALGSANGGSNPAPTQPAVTNNCGGLALGQWGPDLNCGRTINGVTCGSTESIKCSEQGNLICVSNANLCAPGAVGGGTPPAAPPAAPPPPVSDVISCDNPRSCAVCSCPNGDTTKDGYCTRPEDGGDTGATCEFRSHTTACTAPANGQAHFMATHDNRIYCGAVNGSGFVPYVATTPPAPVAEVPPPAANPPADNSGSGSNAGGTRPAGSGSEGGPADSEVVPEPETETPPTVAEEPKPETKPEVATASEQPQPPTTQQIVLTGAAVGGTVATLGAGATAATSAAVAISPNLGNQLAMLLDKVKKVGLAVGKKMVNILKP